MAKPKGQRGSWFATWKGESLPCVHKVYVVRDGAKSRYVDDAVGGNPKWEPFIEAIRRGKKVLLTSDHLDEHGVPGDRDRYLSLWEVDNVVFELPVLSFDFVKRLPPDRFTG